MKRTLTAFQMMILAGPFRRTGSWTISKGKPTVDFLVCFNVCGMGQFWGVESPQVECPAILVNARDKSRAFALLLYPLRKPSTLFSLATVSQVLRRGAGPKIDNPVVRPVPVYVVDASARPIPISHGPYNTVRLKRVMHYCAHFVSNRLVNMIEGRFPRKLGAPRFISVPSFPCEFPPVRIADQETT